MMDSVASNRAKIWKLHFPITGLGRGNLEDAIRLMREALEMQRKALGAEHPDALESVSKLQSFERV